MKLADEVLSSMPRALGVTGANRDLVARVADLETKYAELLEDHARALKRADAFTLETQTCEEAVTALVELLRAARVGRDELISLRDTAARLQAYVDTGETPEMVTKMVEQMKAIGEAARASVALGTSHMITLVKALTTLKP